MTVTVVAVVGVGLFYAGLADDVGDAFESTCAG